MSLFVIMKYLLFIQDFLRNTVLSVATILKVLLLSKRISLPKSQHDELVILGNGPSLKDFLKNHQSFLSGKASLAVNHFADTETYTDIKPGFYMINVPEFWIEDVDTDVLTRRNQLIENLVQKTTWKMQLILGVGAKKSKQWQRIAAQNPNIRLHYINPTPVEGFKWFRFFCYRYNCGMPRPHNVLVPSLMSAINMRFKTIYIAGADHSWLEELFVADDNTVYLTQRHFYDAQTARPDVMKKMGKNRRRLHEILHKFMLSFKAYFDLNTYAESRQVKIYNITKGSFIDAFERLKLSENE